MISHSRLLKMFESKVKLIPYSIDLTSSNFDSSKPNINEVDFSFLAIGRHVGYKGFSVLIEAMKLNKSSLTIVGDGVLFDNHQKLINEYHLNDRVTLLRDTSNEQKEALLAACKALILPSIYPSEAFALVQLEAMKHGKPVINTDLRSGVPWVARDGKEGITVNAGDIHQLNSAINKLENDKVLILKLGKQAKKRYETEYDCYHFKFRILEFLELN